MPQQLIAQISATPAPVTATPSTFSPTAEWGVMGALALIVVQNGWKWFHSKEDSENALIKSLVDGLQTSQTKLLERLVETQQKQHDAITELKVAIESLGAAVRQENQQAIHRQDEVIARLESRLNQMCDR